MILGIYGAGGLGREVYELALDIQDKSEAPKWEQMAFIADYSEANEIHGIQIVTFETFQSCFPAETAEIVIAVGEPQARKKLREKVTLSGYSLATLIHPSARVSRWAELGKGCVVTYGCNVSFSCKLGDNSFLQPSCGMGHDTIIKEDCVISACVRIAGKTKIGSCTYIGMQSAVREGTEIGENVIVGMGSLVHRNIESNMIAMGNPARIIRRNESGQVFCK